MSSSSSSGLLGNDGLVFFLIHDLCLFCLFVSHVEMFVVVDTVVVLCWDVDQDQDSGLGQLINSEVSEPWS